MEGIVGIFDDNPDMYCEIALGPEDAGRSSLPRVVRPAELPTSGKHLVNFDWDINELSFLEVTVLSESFKIPECPMVWLFKIIFRYKEGETDPKKLNSQKMDVYLCRIAGKEDLDVHFSVLSKNTNEEASGSWGGWLYFRPDESDQLLFSTDRPARPSQARAAAKKKLFFLPDDVLCLRGRLAIFNCPDTLAESSPSEEGTVAEEPEDESERPSTSGQ